MIPVVIIVGMGIYYLFKTLTDPNTGANVKEIGSVVAMGHPATRSAAMASKVIQGGAKKLMNKTSLQSLILFILFLIAYKLT
jgi:hypothetical protein